MLCTSQGCGLFRKAHSQKRHRNGLQLNRKEMKAREGLIEISMLAELICSLCLFQYLVLYPPARMDVGRLHPRSDV